MAHPKLQMVRTRYAFCCGYCGVSEADAGGELTVGHFHPVAAGGDHSDENLRPSPCVTPMSPTLPRPVAGVQHQGRSAAPRSAWFRGAPAEAAPRWTRGQSHGCGHWQVALGSSRGHAPEALA
jgi:hypothetical protein